MMQLFVTHRQPRERVIADGQTSFHAEDDSRVYNDRSHISQRVAQRARHREREREREFISTALQHRCTRLSRRRAIIFQYAYIYPQGGLGARTHRKRLCISILPIISLSLLHNVPLLKNTASLPLILLSRINAKSSQRFMYTYIHIHSLSDAVWPNR